MKSITVEFPEVKIKIESDEINFDSLEKMVFEIVQEMGRKVIEKTLEKIDDKLMEGRSKEKLENTGKRSKYLLTRLGDICYRRRRYIEKGSGKARYLLEEKLGLAKNQRTSLGRDRIEMFIASRASYRETEEGVKLVTGWRRSHETIRKKVIKEGERVKGYQEACIERTRNLVEGKEEGKVLVPEIAYMEADSTGIKLQKNKKCSSSDEVADKKERERERGKSIEVKLGIGYTGREKRYGKGTSQRLKDKFIYTGICNGERFMEELSLIAENKLSLSRVKNKFFGGDGAEWIKQGIADYFPGAIYFLCKFHLIRNIKRALCYRREEEKTIKRLIKKEKIEEALNLIKGMIKGAKEEKEKERLKDIYLYILDNKEGIKGTSRIKDKAIRERVKRTGGIEGNIGKAIAHRFKKRGMSWSVKGALSLLKVKEMIINGEWDKWWLSKREEKIEIKQGLFKEIKVKDWWKKNCDTNPVMEATIPALRGKDQDKPWAKVLRDLQSINY